MSQVLNNFTKIEFLDRKLLFLKLKFIIVLNFTQIIKTFVFYQLFMFSQIVNISFKVHF